MRIRNNERGGTLVMVLLLVAVFTILGMGLLSMNISASKQFDKKEEQVQARHLAEMGVIHYQAEVEKAVSEHNLKKPESVKDFIDGEWVLNVEKTQTKHIEMLCEAITGIEAPSYENSSAYVYKVRKNIGESQKCGNVSNTTEAMTVAIDSVGEVDETKKEIAAKVEIKIQGLGGNGNGDSGNNGGGSNGNDENIEVTDEDYEPESYAINNKDNSEKTIYVGRDYKGKQATNLGSGRNTVSNIYVNRNFEDYGGSSSFASGSDSIVNIIVKGDYITNIRPLVGHGSDSKACIVIHGDYFYDTGAPFEEPYINSSSLFYIMGEIKIRDPHTGAIQTHPNYERGKKFGNPSLNCPIDFPEAPTPSIPDDNKWIVQPEVNAEYK